MKLIIFAAPGSRTWKRVQEVKFLLAEGLPLVSVGRGDGRAVKFDNAQVDAAEVLRRSRDVWLCMRGLSALGATTVNA